MTETAQDISYMEISLADFAMMGGSTEKQYLESLACLLESGRMMETLTEEGQYRIGEWIGDAFLDGGGFVVRFGLSMGRNTNPALHCLCHMDMSGDEPAVVVEKMETGTDGSPMFAFETHSVDFREMRLL